MINILFHKKNLWGQKKKRKKRKKPAMPLPPTEGESGPLYRATRALETRFPAFRAFWI